ncbi:MAG: hypothetical protein ACOZNI_30800 [Myxococcota bacterium]
MSGRRITSTFEAPADIACSSASMASSGSMGSTPRARKASACAAAMPPPDQGAHAIATTPAFSRAYASSQRFAPA